VLAGREKEQALQKMKIGTVLFDQSKGAAVVTLVEEAGDRVLPIFIGIWEGMAIFRELNRAPSQRPVLHDLLHNILVGFQARLEKVTIDSLSDSTYYAQLHIRQHDAMLMVADARPSDALALALKFQAPIYVAEAILAAAGKRGDFAASEEAEGETPASEEDVRAWLENIRPEDFADPQ
jgi:bifunctional DNase/RNase